MHGTRGGLGRMIAMGIALALSLLLLVVEKADAGKYSVAQCGWHIGADAGWADTTGGAKFRPDSYCATPPGADPFDGAHLKSFTRDGQPTVSGTRFARWRWDAPPGTSITRVSGTWWHALHDGIEQRIGVATWNSGFDVFAAAGSTDTTPRDFVAGFSPGMPALEDRLLCARAESKSCSLDPGSWSAIRALTLTIEDDSGPGAAIGGDLLAGGWRRGGQGIQVWGSDTGGGVRFGETTLDGARVALTEYPCAKEMIGGEWRATRMRPCELGVSASQALATTGFSDGPHNVGHCVSDFAGNVGCTPLHTVLIDNNPPAHPRNLALTGGDGWRRANDFDLTWENPDQGPASPIGGAAWRVVGPAGFDTGTQFTAGRGLAALANLSVPHAGTYSLSIWLRDEAGNEAPPSAISMPLRLDNVPPGVAFAADSGPGLPDSIRADVSDEHSGPSGGEVDYRRLGVDTWTELPTKFARGEEPGKAQLVASLPNSLQPGVYVFRAEAVDAAGNVALTTRRADGTEMALRKPDSPAAEKHPAAASQPRSKTRIFARLRWHRRHGISVTVPFGAVAALSGRLVDADGAGLAGRRLRVVARPSRGALSSTRAVAVETGPHGGFRLQLPAGPSRRIAVVFGGEERLDAAARAPLSLRVSGGVVFNAAPIALSTGQAVRFWGRVRAQGAPLPRRGKLVAIQYLESATGRWRPVLVTRSDHSGHFRVRYRFRYISGSARIRLRAVALAEERWPYAPGASRSLTVSVTG
jgi:hypothetical protein